MYKLLYDNPNEDLLTRLLKIRNIEDNIENFLNPTFSNYRLDPFLLNDMEKSIKRIIKAIDNKEKIMIFGDYDVDGITSSFVIYKFFQKYLNYKNISIRLPNRIHDGYGIKKYHIDQINEIGASLIITVDNGITAIVEAQHAKKLNIDIIITDHHQALDEIPDAYSIVNPHISKDYSFKQLAGVGVAFKLITALASKLIKDNTIKNKIINYFLPLVAIGTVGDVVPLINENRMLTKIGIDIINQKKGIPSSLTNTLRFLNIKGNIDTYHIGFIIAPRINAGGRMLDPVNSLNCFLYRGSKQLEYLEKIETLNNQRKELQEKITKQAEELIDNDQNLLIAYSESFLDGLIGLAAGKLCEKYYKPTIIMSINKTKKEAVASLRGPDYFNIVKMLDSAKDYLERYGGHKQAGGFTLKLKNLDQALKLMNNYAKENIKKKVLEKTTLVDTIIHKNELSNDIVYSLENLAPFGEGNPQPTFLIENVNINNIEKVGKNGNGHMKLYGEKDGIKFPILFWGKGNEIDQISINESKNIVGKLKRDDYNGGFMVDGSLLI